jgi:hypothetical protein
MSDTTEASKGPKIRVFLKTGQKLDREAPMIGFVRLKIIPLQTEPGVQEDEGHAEPVKRNAFFMSGQIDIKATARALSEFRQHRRGV